MFPSASGNSEVLGEQNKLFLLRVGVKLSVATNCNKTEFCTEISRRDRN